MAWSLNLSLIENANMESTRKIESGIALESRALSLDYYRKSFLAHVIFLAIFLSWTYLFPSRPLVIQPAIQVDIVALPDFTKGKDNMVDTSLPPKEDVKPVPQPIDIPDPTPDVMKLPEKEKKPDVKSKEEPASRESAKKALERIRKELAEKDRAEQKRQIEDKKKDIERFDEKFRARLAGNSVSHGNSVSGVPAEVTDAYLGHIVDRIRANWELPAYLQSSNLRAAVRLYVDGNGSVRYQLSKRSGNEVFDNLVKDAIERAKPFAPPPEGLASELRRNGLEVLFPL